MQATLDSTGLKHLTRALTCLSKFGEDVVVVATADTFALSSTNVAMSAYGRFKYGRSFFSKYRVDARPPDDDGPSVSGQIATKPLLNILKHRANEKACEKCEFVITDGPTQDPQPDDETENHDTLESRLTVRLHCKHGVVKTYRLTLNPASSMSPTMPDPTVESRLTIGPKPLKSLLEHFPFGKGGKSDPQLVWNFWDDEVQLRSLESSVDAKGRAQLATELTISAEEFEQYDLQTGSITIAFHLREFNATIAFAEASQLPLDIRFTDPTEPLYINVDNELSDTLFVIATSQVQSVSQQNTQSRQRDEDPSKAVRGKKRPLEDDSNQGNVRSVERMRNGDSVGGRQKKPMKVVHPADRASIAREMNPPPLPPQPSWAVLTAAQQNQQDEQYDECYDDNPPELAGPSQPSQQAPRVLEQEPLFLPSSQLSQLPPATQSAIINTGLGIENMTAEELEAMLEGDAEEVEFSQGRVKRERAEEELGYADDDWRSQGQMDSIIREGGYGARGESLELVDDMEMAPTQNTCGTKVFRPLFED